MIVKDRKKEATTTCVRFMQHPAWYKWWRCACPFRRRSIQTPAEAQTYTKIRIDRQTICALIDKE